jgi:hypothetical protein
MKISTRIIQELSKNYRLPFERAYQRAKLEDHSFRKEGRVRERKSGSFITVNPFV